MVTLRHLRLAAELPHLPWMDRYRQDLSDLSNQIYRLIERTPALSGVRSTPQFHARGQSEEAGDPLIEPMYWLLTYTNPAGDSYEVRKKIQGLVEKHVLMFEELPPDGWGDLRFKLTLPFPTDKYGFE